MMIALLDYLLTKPVTTDIPASLVMEWLASVARCLKKKVGADRCVPDQYRHVISVLLTRVKWDSLWGILLA